MVSPNKLNLNRPPLREVILTVQFEEVPSLDLSQILSFWKDFLSQDFPNAKNLQSLPSQVEHEAHTVSQSQFFFTTTDEQALPRVLFSSKDLVRVVQIQNNRISFNWRKITEDNEYPRFETVLNQFLPIYDEFRERVYPSLRPNQVEVVYSNHVPVINNNRVDEIFKLFDFGPFQNNDLERLSFSSSQKIYIDKEFKGRHYIDIFPIIDKSFVPFNLLTRLRIINDSVKDSLYKSREYVHNSFLTVVADKYMKEWE